MSAIPMLQVFIGDSRSKNKR